MTMTATVTADPVNELYESLTGAERSRLGFVEEVRRSWARELFPALRREFDATAPAAATTDLDHALAHMRSLPSYPWFGWLEREAQKMKWRQLMEMAQAHPEAVAVLDASDQVPQRLAILPDWYTDIDIHCQPGGVWWSDQAAVVYELGARILHMGRNTSLELHRLFTDRCFAPIGDAGRIVDLGCGFGKSTVPFAERFGGAEVIGMDLSLPVLRLAHHRARQRGLDITFTQADASDVPLPSGSCDIVTGTMVLHELPLPVLERTLQEAARLLKPGGQLRFLEFARTGDTFRDAAMVDHAMRNNEPFIPQLMQVDVAGMLTAAGLTDAGWVPFDERGAGPCPDGFPPRPEWHFPWAVLTAARP